MDRIDSTRMNDPHFQKSNLSNWSYDKKIFEFSDIHTQIVEAFPFGYFTAQVDTFSTVVDKDLAV